MKYPATIYFLVLVATMSSCGSKTPWNPYLSMKEKPSEQQMRQSNEVIAKGNKAYKKQIEQNKQNIRANNAKATKMKKHYHYRKLKKGRKTRR